jgi:hypothetical protein
MVTQFVCEKGHLFIYPEKVTYLKSEINPESLEPMWIGNVRVEDATRISETHVCPYCQSLDLDEHVEPEAAITSVKSVDLADVDEWLKKGYVVHELYAKTATLKLLAKEGEVA